LPYSHERPTQRLLRNRVGLPVGRLETTRIVLTGQVTEQCILYSALDGYVRHFDVVVPPDAVAHIDPELGDAALKMMRRNMRAELRPSADCPALATGAVPPRKGATDPRLRQESLAALLHELLTCRSHWLFLPDGQSKHYCVSVGGGDAESLAKQLFSLADDVTHTALTTCHGHFSKPRHAAVQPRSSRGAPICRFRNKHA
jgi:hypothetical protein